MSAAVAEVFCIVCRSPMDDGETVPLANGVAHAECWERVKQRREQEREAAIARGVCRECSQPLDASPVLKRLYRALDAFHAGCWARVEGRERARAERERAESIKTELRRLEVDFERCLSGPYTDQNRPLLTTPRWSFARFDNAEFRQGSTIVAAVEAWKPSDGSLLLCAPTGEKKTSSCIAWIFRSYDLALERAKRGERAKLDGFAFITGPELVTARRNTKLGNEATLITLAKEKRILFLDELTSEPLSEVVFEVIDERYRAERPTVVTTGLRASEWRARYGDAAYRRIAQGGAVVEAFR
jgi:hypothetical protein